ncbi:SDR family NAD(P)-dependent oxidoreductase [Qipengyuania flava]|uniref:SDR family NAD(P)-dependent oxidoreductase n=1 Tax=Qipengyuania flava TaxID=192812 RepID=UPI001CD491B0|nr:SDR family NAD(P)-dependent oxidoreductase [Qipengyuania flava]MCA0891784.1 SDR family oxidoreductase [Qipengyuania flava]
MTGFDNKVALVTGGGHGIGAAISRRLASDGAQVIVADVDAKAAGDLTDELATAGHSAFALELDVRDPAQIKEAVPVAEANFGRPVELLVNNAGISRPGPLLDITIADWEAHHEVNLRGMFLMCQAFLPSMIERKSGKIVNACSALGREGFKGYAAYSSSKFGVLGLTQCIASEFGEFNITANCVVPGIVKTRMWGATLNEFFGSEGEGEEYIKDRMMLRRSQEAEDLAEMVAFLLSEKARNITAATFHVDGGMVPR